MQCISAKTPVNIPIGCGAFYLATRSATIQVDLAETSASFGRVTIYRYEPIFATNDYVLGD